MLRWHKWGVDAWLQSFTSSSDGGEWSASSWLLDPQVEIPQYHPFRGWLGLRASLDIFEKRLNLLPQLGVETQVTEMG
jgi:hypothetical protein